jgi:hypothetical protein
LAQLQSHLGHKRRNQGVDVALIKSMFRTLDPEIEISVDRLALHSFDDLNCGVRHFRGVWPATQQKPARIDLSQGLAATLRPYFIAIDINQQRCAMAQPDTTSVTQLEKDAKYHDFIGGLHRPMWP